MNHATRHSFLERIRAGRTQSMFDIQVYTSSVEHGKQSVDVSCHGELRFLNLASRDCQT